MANSCDVSAFLFKVDKLHQFAERAAHTQNSHKITPRERKRKRQEINPCPSL
nr:MAG TPA_asm: hypothetical protein [Caudoviricetes sp.]DAO64743.1 MAG TPA: hypothetical protein [Caudoviricetes sp.]